MIFFPKASQYSVAGITVDVDSSLLAVTTRDSTTFFAFNVSLYFISLERPSNLKVNFFGRLKQLFTS